MIAISVSIIVRFLFLFPFGDENPSRQLTMGPASTYYILLSDYILLSRCIHYILSPASSSLEGVDLWREKAEGQQLFSLLL